MQRQKVQSAHLKIHPPLIYSAICYWGQRSIQNLHKPAALTSEGLFSLQPAAQVWWAQDSSQLFGQSEEGHLEQGWPGTASGTLQAQAQTGISGCTVGCCYPPYSFRSFGPSCLYVTSVSPNSSSAVLQPWKRPLGLPRIPPKIWTTTDEDTH